MPKGGGAPGLALLPFMIVILIVFSVLSFLPVNPTLMTEFSITPGPSIIVNTNSTSTFYYKATVIGSIGTPQGLIRLSRLGSQIGTYSLNVTVSYGGVVLSNQTFPQIGNGNYRMQIQYGTRSESTSTPYLIAISLLSSSNTIVTSTNVSLFP